MPACLPTIALTLPLSLALSLASHARCLRLLPLSFEDANLASQQHMFRQSETHTGSAFSLGVSGCSVTLKRRQESRGKDELIAWTSNTSIR